MEYISQIASERRDQLPQPPGSRLNKKVATWCNEYVLRHAKEIWVGDLLPNGMLTVMLKALHRIG